MSPFVRPACTRQAFFVFEFCCFFVLLGKLLWKAFDKYKTIHSNVAKRLQFIVKSCVKLAINYL